MITQIYNHNENTFSPLPVYALTGNNYCITLHVVEVGTVVIETFISFLSQASVKLHFIWITKLITMKPYNWVKLQHC